MRETLFRLTPEHVALLRRMNVGWHDCEYGAPEIDPKRPYGNSWVEGDIAEILGWTWAGEDMPDEMADRARALHEETRAALQIVLRCGTFEPGLFKRTETWSSDWRRIP
jgi:hypothetical protein